MPAIFPKGAQIITQIRLLAQRGDLIAEGLMALMNNTYYCQMSAGTEASNVIRITGQIFDQDGNKIAAAKDIVVTSFPVSGAGTMAAVSSQGTVKTGGGTKVVWVQTKADGSFQLDVTNAVAEDNLIKAELDNGTAELLKLTYA